MSTFVTYLVMLSAILLPLQRAFSAPLDFNQIAGGFTKTMVQCPSRIWPNYDWKTVQVIIVDSTNSVAVIWKGADQSVSKLDIHTLPQSALTSTFSYLELNGTPTLVLSRTKSYDNESELFRLGTHEFFHKLGQANWKKSSTVRGTEYPIDPKPRIYRRMLYDRLRDHLFDNKDTLGQAAYWFNKWKLEYPQESLNTTDGYEGSAVYVEEMSEAIRLYGCDTPDSRLIDEAKSIFAKTRNGASVSGTFFDLSTEGYDIGTVSALILRRREPSGDWFNKTAAGKTMTGLLLENVAPIPEGISPELTKLFNSTADKTNSEIGSLVDTDIQNFNLSSTVHISVPLEWLQANLGPKYFILSEKLPGMMIMPMARNLEFKAGQFKLETPLDKIFFAGGTNPCPPGISIVIGRSELNFGGSDVIDFNSAGVSGHLKIIKSETQIGSWYCAVQ